MLVKGMKSVYTSERFLPDRDAIKIWYQMLKDLDYKAASAAVQKHILTSKYPPTIADIREAVSELVNGEEMTWGESWAAALNAVRRYGFHRKAEALESLDPMTRRCVNAITFEALCLMENDAVMATRAHYQKLFEVMQKRELEEKRLPLPLRETIGELQGKQTGLTSMKDILGIGGNI